MSTTATIEQLQIEIETQADGAIKGLKGLKSALESVEKAGQSDGLDKVCQKLEKISSINFSNLTQLTQLVTATKNLGDASKKLGKVTSAIPKKPFDDLAQGAKSATAAIDGLPEKVDISGVDTARVETEKLQGALDKARTKVKLFGKDAQKSTKKAQNGFAQLFKIVVIYGTAFRLWMTFTQGVSEGLQNIAQYSNETKTAMSKLSTMSLQLKNSIGAALYPVIVSITPALQALANVIIKALNAINQFVATISGKDTYIRAKEYLKEYGDTAKNTADKIKKSFAGMDEITVIGKKDSSSDDNPADMFEEVPLDNQNTALGKLGKWIRDNPETAAKIGKVALAVGAVLLAVKGLEWLGEFTGITRLVSSLSNLGKKTGDVTSAFGDKNDALKDQTKKTGLETSAVLALAGALGIITVGATKLVDWLKEHPIEFPIRNPIPVLAETLSAAKTRIGEFTSTVFGNITQWVEDVTGLRLDFQPVIGTAISNATANISAFTVATADNIRKWARNVSENVRNATSNIATNVYNAFLSAATNIRNFVSSSSQSFANWCNNMATNMRNTAKNIAENFGSGLSSAWENFKKFCAATGEAISTFWSKNKAAIITTTVAVGLVAAGVLLAPYTGGASLALAAFAEGGFPTPGELFIANEQGAEFVGSMGGRPAVANNDQIVEGIASGVYAANQEQNRLLVEQNKLLQQLIEKQSNGQIDVTTITAAMHRKNRRDGKTIVPVGI